MGLPTGDQLARETGDAQPAPATCHPRPATTSRTHSMITKEKSPIRVLFFRDHEIPALEPTRIGVCGPTRQYCVKQVARKGLAGPGGSGEPGGRPSNGPAGHTGLGWCDACGRARAERARRTWWVSDLDGKGGGRRGDFSPVFRRTAGENPPLGSRRAPPRRERLA